MSVVLFDGVYQSSPPDQYILVDIQRVNYPPEVNLHGPVAFMYDTIINYVEGEGPVPLAPNATIVDKDNTTLVRLVARLLNLYDQPLEVLSVFGDHPNIIVITVSCGTIPDYVMEQS